MILALMICRFPTVLIICFCFTVITLRIYIEREIDVEDVCKIKQLLPRLRQILYIGSDQHAASIVPHIHVYRIYGHNIFGMKGCFILKDMTLGGRQSTPFLRGMW